MKDYFPVFQEPSRRNLAYLDTAASSQICAPALRAVNEYYASGNANVHRGVYPWADNVTEVFLDTKEKLSRWLSAPEGGDFIFCSGTTHALNLLARVLCERFTQAGDKVVLTQMEHHANIIPWQRIASERDLDLVYLRLNTHGELDWQDFDFSDSKIKILSLTHVSNVLGCVNPLQKILAKARDNNVLSVVDGAQAVAHLSVDLGKLNPDFYVFSTHKMYSMGGLGCLYARERHLRNAEPFLTGGGMVREVGERESDFADFPEKYEPGTPNLAAIAALSATLDFFREKNPCESGESGIEALMEYALDEFGKIPQVRPVGKPTPKQSLFSFTVDGIHAHDLASFLGEGGVMMRAGHHCAMPLMKVLKIDACLRFSLGMYNDLADVRLCVETLKKAIRFFS